MLSLNLHQAQRSITFQMRESLNDFLREQHAVDEQFPSTMRELEQSAGIRLVITDRADPDDVGFIQWRVALYATNLMNCLFLLDGWFSYKQKRQPPGSQPMEVEVHRHTGASMEVSREDFMYKHLEIKEVASELPLKVFEAQPPAGKRITTLNLQVEGEEMEEESDTESNRFNLVVTGYIWPYRHQLDELGLGGGYLSADADVDGGSVSKSYCRVWKAIDASSQEDTAKFKKMVKEAFHNAALRVIVDSKLASSSSISAFLEELQQMPSLFFCNSGDVQEE